jgi:hypothetical protein
MGVVIDSPLGASEVAEVLDLGAQTLAYEVRLAPDGRNLVWIDRDDAGNVREHTVDPETGWSQRLVVGFLAGLPIDWML